MNRLLTYLILLIFAAGCVSDKVVDENIPVEYYIESKLSFFNPYEVTYADGKDQGYTYEKWIRQPENMLMVHETFKKIGYKNLITEYQLTSNVSLLIGYSNISLNTKIDSLVLTYGMDTIRTKYYREFWQRRKKENNDSTVYIILKDVAKELLKNETVTKNEELVNDTLYQLVVMDRVNINPNKEQAIDDFNYLVSIGLCSSAYNLLYESYRYQDIDWNKEELTKKLMIDNTNCCPYSWVKDDTK